MFLFDSSEPCLTKKKIFFQKILAFFLQFSDIIKVPGNWLLPRRPINYVGKFRSPEALAKHVPIVQKLANQVLDWETCQEISCREQNTSISPTREKRIDRTEKRGDNICWGKLALGNVTSHVMHVLTNIWAPDKKAERRHHTRRKKKPKKPVAWEAIACSFSSTTSFPRPAL